MLSEDRIKKMIRLSDYETGVGEADLRRTKYRKRDYVRLQVLRTIAGAVAATFLILLMVILYFYDSIPWKTLVSEGLFTIHRTMYLVAGILVWILLVAILAVINARNSRTVYDESELRVDEYQQTLSELLQLYEAERKEDGV